MKERTYTTKEAMKKLDVTRATLDRRAFRAKIEPKKERIGGTRSFRNIYTESEIKRMGAMNDPRQAKK